jgi:hypothetical protein
MGCTNAFYEMEEIDEAHSGDVVCVFLCLTIKRSYEQFE